MRLALQLLPGSGIKRATVGIVEQFEADPELKASLQQKPPKGQLVRQVDIRPGGPDGPIEFKFFISWDWKLNMWHVFVEGAKETVFEEGELNY